MITWRHHDKTKYQRELDSLMESYDNEMQKPSYSEREKYPNRRPRDFRDMRLVDDITRRVHNIGKVYFSSRTNVSDV